MTTELELNKYIGKKLLERRKELKMNLKEVGDHINLSPQQIVKYESGVNRVSAGTLYKIAKLLDVSMLYFYKGADEGSIKINPETNTVEVRLPNLFEIKST
jgi:transcriptional regulator with XRE-family HTH domain